MAQIEFMKRTDGTEAINTAIGNVSLPMHPAMIERMKNLGEGKSPFKEGVVKYTPTVGMEETNRAFLNIIASSGFSTGGLYSQVTDGGSQAMELVILGTCGPAGSSEKPLFLIDPAYTNYNAMASRLGRKTVSVTRTLDENGKFTLPDMNDIEAAIEKARPGAMVVIPFDNPTGQFMSQQSLIALAKICVKYDMWMISDEAYRELFYQEGKVVSIWGMGEDVVPGIVGRRISIETSSKVWNACGLRIGGLITDNKAFHEKAVAENTANLCPNAIGQYIFGSLAHQSHNDLAKWYRRQREYYRTMLSKIVLGLKEKLPDLIVSSPDASIYSVLDVRNLVSESFDAIEFVMYCAREGRIEIDGCNYTLLTAPMAGFYSGFTKAENPGRTQMRIAYVETPKRMELVPRLFSALLRVYAGLKGELLGVKVS